MQGPSASGGEAMGSPMERDKLGTEKEQTGQSLEKKVGISASPPRSHQGRQVVRGCL